MDFICHERIIKAASSCERVCVWPAEPSRSAGSPAPASESPAEAPPPWTRAESLWTWSAESETSGCRCPRWAAEETFRAASPSHSLSKHQTPMIKSEERLSQWTKWSLNWVCEKVRKMQMSQRHWMMIKQQCMASGGSFRVKSTRVLRLKCLILIIFFSVEIFMALRQVCSMQLLWQK